MKQLTTKSVHIWRADLDLPLAQIHAFQHVLSADEQARAARFSFPRDRQYFIAARGILRSLLGRYLHVHPSMVRFTYQTYGKPILARPFGETNITFNLSHHNGLALFAFSKSREVGIDLVGVDYGLNYMEIAEQFFAPAEYAHLCALPVAQQQIAFFRAWARKEAYIKARGTGMHMPLDRFVVTLAPGEPARLLYTYDDPAEADRWELLALAPAAYYQAAIAVEGHGWQPLFFHWSARIKDYWSVD
jgi:4'-phosphopantetheinyl transferase